MTPEEQEQLIAARKGRYKALALVLLGFVVLFFAITIAKIGLLQ
jgi:hypothetical protein